MSRVSVPEERPRRTAPSTFTGAFAGTSVLQRACKNASPKMTVDSHMARGAVAKRARLINGCEGQDRKVLESKDALRDTCEEE